MGCCGPLEASEPKLSAVDDTVGVGVAFLRGHVSHTRIQ